MKRFITGAILAGLVLGMVIVPQVGRAEGDSSLRARLEALLEQVAALKAKLGMGGGSAIPEKGISGTVVSSENFAKLVTAFPEGEDDGDFVQFNNLRIETIALAPSDTAGGVTAIITATQDFGIRCQKFENQGSSVAKPLPCPVPAERVYTIRTDAETRFFLRDRTRATLADLAPGDAINVYGYLLRATKGIQALVVRNLDKPVVDKFFQLNNVEVVTAPTSLDAPTTFVVAQRGVSPCLDFGERGVSGIVMPCPMGMEVAEKSVSAAQTTAPTIVAPLRKYVVAVTKETRLIDRNKLAIALRDIAVGDTLNVYGKITGTDRSTITAAVVRDLSKPKTDRAGALRVIVTDITSACPEPADPVSERPTLCGVIYTAGVSLADASGATVAKATTETGAALFDGLAPGNYIVYVSAPGYEDVKKEARVDLRGESLLGVTLRSKQSSGITITTDSKLAGSVGAGFTAAFTASGGGGSYEWSIVEGALPPGLEFTVPISRGPVIMCIKAPCPQPGSTQAIVKGVPKIPGTYTFVFSATDASGRTGTGRFTITITSTPTNAPLSCSPEFWQVGSGGTAYLAASGGDGTYTWSAPDGGVLMVTAGASNEFSMANTGNAPVIARVLVSSGGQTRTCKVRVLNTVQAPLACTPSVQQVRGGKVATMSVELNLPANAGAPAPESIMWSAPGGTPGSGVGLTFATMFRNTGSFVQVQAVNVRMGDRSGSCIVRVAPEGNTQDAGIIER